jgi:hypothetical protein
MPVDGHLHVSPDLPVRTVPLRCRLVGLVGPRACPDPVKESKISYSCRELNHDSLVVQPLYQIRYPVSCMCCTCNSKQMTMTYGYTNLGLGTSTLQTAVCTCNSKQMTMTYGYTNLWLGTSTLQTAVCTCNRMLLSDKCSKFLAMNAS